jgi:hypothetical protein
MKITITPAGGTAFTLGDDSANPAAAIVDGFRPRQTRQVQRQALFRAPYKADLPRFNLENTLTFVVERQFATREAALNFMAKHPDQVPTQGTVKLYDLSTTGQTSRTLANAMVTDVECIEHTGVSCKFQYAIAGNGPWT